MVNVERLRAELEFIEENPSLWDQSKWVSKCGTYGCLAGNALLHNGYQIDTNDPDPRLVVKKDGINCGNIFDTAADVLGLTYGQANMLFDSINSLNTLWELAKLFTDGAIKRPPEEKPVWIVANMETGEITEQSGGSEVSPEEFIGNLS